MIIVPNLTQGSAEWLATRLGVLTASQVVKLLTPTGKLSSQRKDLVATLVAETLLGEPVDDFGGTYWTERGTMLEDQALAYFALQTDLEPRQVGFVYRNENKDAGCSPDALIYSGDDCVAGLELKCPKAGTHVGYLLDERADKYTPQVQFSLWVTQLPAWYFMSYHVGLPPFLVKVLPDDAWQDAFETHVPDFLDEVRAAVHKLRGE